MTLLRLTAYLLFLVSALSAHAENWKSVPGISPTVLVDQDSVRRDGDRVTFWMKYNEPVGAPMYFKQPDGSVVTKKQPVARTIMSQNEYDCRLLRNATLHIMEYLNGNMVSDYDVHLNSSVIVPGTAPEKISKFVCKRSYEFWK